MHQLHRRRTDLGTVLLHWIGVAALTVSLLTGLRIAVDLPERSWLGLFRFIFPEGQIWDLHVWSGFALMGLGLSYGIYVAKAGLMQRVKLDRVRFSSLRHRGEPRWKAFNVFLYWLLFTGLSMQAATGLLLYMGWGGFTAQLHYAGAIFVLTFPVLHVFGHLRAGGLAQLLRIFRPDALPQAARQKSFTQLLLEQYLRQREGELRAHPLATAVGAGLVGVMALLSLDRGLPQNLEILRVERAIRPMLDGDLADTAWLKTSSVSVLTNQGVNFGGTSSSRVEIRAVHDGQNAYFAFTWDDPTRSLKHLPLIKREDGWHLLHTEYDIEDEDAYYEDKFAVMFAHAGDAGGPASAHMGKRPLPGMPAAYSGRGLHFTDGAMLDVWHWKAARGGLLGYVDDNYFSTPAKPKPEEAAGKQRYKAGYATDQGKAFYANNFKHEPAGGYRGPVQPARLPANLDALRASMGRIDLAPDHGEDEYARWWMLEEDSVAYSEALDAAIPVGTVIPGVLISGAYSGSRADVRGAARWSAGRWTLEVARAISTGDKNDVAIETGAQMWVSAFDHSQTRHTRHLRPVLLEVEP
jgi:hypothetical protein